MHPPIGARGGYNYELRLTWFESCLPSGTSGTLTVTAMFWLTDKAPVVALPIPLIFARALVSDSGSRSARLPRTTSMLHEQLR